MTHQPDFDFYADAQDYTPSQEDALREAMKKQWREDQETVRDRGIIPDWAGEPHPLSRDKARLLELLYEVGSVQWTTGPSANNREVTRAIGLTNTGNAKAVIDMCHTEGLVESRVYRGSRIFEMSQEGEYALSEHQLEVELGLV